MDIMTEATLKKVLEKVQMQNALVAAIAGATPGSIKVNGWESVSEIVKAGLAPKVFAVGDQFICPWTDKANGKTYDFTWDIRHIGTVTLEDGTEVPGMYLRAHYCTPFGIQFDAPENELATEETFLKDYFYYTKNEDGSFTLQNVTAGETVPAETVYYHSEIKDTTGNICRYGYNRWSHSALRQFLNSDSPDKGGWWKPMHLGDMPPSELNQRAGFLSGFEEDFLSVIKPVKIRTQLNAITDSALGTDEATVDKMFVESKEQMYGSRENGIYNDEVFDYYKQTTGLSAPSNNNNAGRITYRLESKTTPDWIRLRSPYRGYSYYTWICGGSGSLLNYGIASPSVRFAQACVIA